MSEQLDLFYTDEMKAMDIVANMVYRMGHDGLVEKMLYSNGHCSLAGEYLKQLRETQPFKDADERRKQRYWDLMKKTAERVDSWPDWKKGK